MADIFVSYTSRDRLKAFWIGQELKKLGHTPRIHEWEIPAGGDIPKWMEERHDGADHILCVISKAYLAAPYSSWERRAAQWAAADDERPNFALPVFIEKCKPPTMLAHIKRCDLFGLTEETARERLANYLAPAAQPSEPVGFSDTDNAVASDTAPASKPRLESGSYYAASNIPIAVPRHFLGRAKVLAEIRKALGKDRGRVAITALHGLRGVGKTTLAAAYAEKYRADYRATWWIRAQTDSTIRADLVALGVRLGWVAADEKEEAALLTVKEKLRHEGEGILLIFDNANNQDELRSYLPGGGAAQILVTSNAPNWAGVASPVQIKVWPKETGAEFFLSRVPGRGSERAAAEELSQALGGLPLAHEQAAAFCERLGLSFAEYLKRFAATPSKLLDTEKDAPAEYHDRMTVAKTFALAIDEAAKLHPGAAPLIEHAALLAPEAIPLFLFSEGREEFDEPLVSALAGDGLDEAVAALRAFALIDRESIPDERDPGITTDCIRLHRLVREVAAARREGDARDGMRRAAIRAMVAVYPIDVFTHPSTWVRARRLDAVAVALLAPELPLPDGVEKEAVRILGLLDAYRQKALAAYSEARALAERALAISEKVSGPEHSATATCLSNLAYLLRLQGDLAAARPLLERAVAIDEKVNGPEHAATAMTVGHLASLLHAQGDLLGARRLFERALAIGEKTVGPEDPAVATRLHNLALLLLEQGELAAARPLFERALAIYERKLGPEHHWTAASLVGFARLLKSEGDAIGALAMLQRGLAIDEKIFGPEHPETKADAGFVAKTLNELGRTREAKTLLEKYGMSQGRKE